MAEVKIQDGDIAPDTEEKTETAAATEAETSEESEAEQTGSDNASEKTSESDDIGEPEEENKESEENKADDTKPEEEKSSEETAKEETKKTGFFGKLKKEDKEIKELKEKTAALTDQVKRQMAEFDNFRKRTDKEKEQMFSMGEKSVAEKMLPIVDNFERGLTTIEEEDKDDAFVKGMEKVYQQMIKQLADIGVTPIEAVGKEFDPNFHNAVMQVESEEYESGVVAQELQKGYMYHDQVLRHSMVSVVQ